MWLMALALIQDETPDLVADTPKVKAILARRAERAPALKAHFDASRIGETKAGALEIRSEDGLDVAQKAALRKAVDEENDDRAKLIAELGRVNDKVPADEVRRRWVDARRRACEKGWTLQNDHGVWKQKRAKKGELEDDFNKKE